MSAGRALQFARETAEHHPMRLSLTARTLAGGLLLALVVSAAIALLALRIDRAQRASGRQDRSAETIAAANLLQQSVLDLETGLRGYLLGGGDRFLQPYREAEARYPRQTSQLVRLTASEPAQRARAEAIRAAVVRYHGGWTRMLVDLSHRDLAGARRLEASGAGKERVDAIRGRLARFLAVEQRIARGEQESAERGSATARTLAFGAIGFAFLATFVFVLWLHRGIVLPVRRLGRAAHAIAGGVLSTRVADDGVAEIRTLKRNFNEMAAALEANRDELEAQNAELEGQQLEIEHTLENLAVEQHKLARISDFAGGLVGMPSLAQTADFVLDRLCAVAGAQIGTLYGSGVTSPHELVLRAVRGIGYDEVSDVLPPVGLAARAVQQREVVTTAYGESELRLQSFNGEVHVRDEIHVPLLRGDTVVGLVSLARVGERHFTPTEIDLIDRLATLAGVALEQARSLTHAERLASLNRTLIEAMPDGIRLLDLDGSVLSENPAMGGLAAALGVGSTNVYGSTEDVAEQMTDPDAYRASLAALRQEPGLEASFEFTVRASGRSFRRHSVPVVDGGGRPVARLFVVHETTQERDLDRLKEEFVATVSHELRTPLASIVGFVELLLGEEPGELTDDQREFLEIVRRSSQRLHRLVGDLLFVSRVDARQLDLEREEVRLDEIARASVQSALPDARRRDVELAAELVALPAIDGDGARIGQVLDNLLSNALKFTPAGGRVTVATEASERGVAVVVSDTGIGIPEDEAERLFRRFFRASSAIDAQIPGTGLGLAITKAIVDAHSGTIAVSNRPGGGTVFRVELPIAHPLREAA
jgi:signal transduction histidine kinase